MLSLQARLDAGKFKAGSIAHDLLSLMISKQTNLCVSADVETSKELINLIHQVGPHICILKTHIDIISDFTLELSQKLQELAKQYNFLIFEDRKFNDIGNTVKKQYNAGIYRIRDWAHIVNCMVLAGEGVLQALLETEGKEVGVLVLAQMSSAGNLCKGEYLKAAVEMAVKYRDKGVFGFIGQDRKELQEAYPQPLPDFLLMTPGVALKEGSDSLGQRYKTPEEVILKSGVDIIIVGRAIVNSQDPSDMAKQFKSLAWNSLLLRDTK